MSRVENYLVSDAGLFDGGAGSTVALRWHADCADYRMSPWDPSILVMTRLEGRRTARWSRRLFVDETPGQHQGLDQGSEPAVPVPSKIEMMSERPQHLVPGKSLRRAAGNLPAVNPAFRLTMLECCF